MERNEQLIKEANEALDRDEFDVAIVTDLNGEIDDAKTTLRDIEEEDEEFTEKYAWYFRPDYPLYGSGDRYIEERSDELDKQLEEIRGYISELEELVGHFLTLMPKDKKA